MPFISYEYKMVEMVLLFTALQRIASQSFQFLSSSMFGLPWFESVSDANGLQVQVE